MRAPPGRRPPTTDVSASLGRPLSVVSSTAAGPAGAAAAAAVMGTVAAAVVVSRGTVAAVEVVEAAAGDRGRVVWWLRHYHVSVAAETAAVRDYLTHKIANNLAKTVPIY